jgi:putative nucleotidyltransferase with HDIG domain
MRLRFRFPTNLRVRLILLVLAALLPALVFSLYAYFEHRAHTAAAAQQQALTMARYAAGRNEQLVTSTRDLLALLARLPEVRSGTVEECNGVLAGLLGDSPTYANIGLIEPDGRLSCSALPFTGTVDLSDRAYFRLAVQTRAFAAGEYQVGRITGRSTINFAYPVLDDVGPAGNTNATGAGGLRGVVYAAVDLDWLNRLAVQSDLPPGSSLALLDSQGTILARYPDPETWVGRQVDLPGALRSAIAERSDGVAELAGADGVERLYAFTSAGGTEGEQGGGEGMSEAGAQGGAVYVTMGIPSAVAYAEADEMLTRNLITLALSAAIGLLAARLVAGYLVLGNVEALVGATRRLAEGDLRARTGVTHPRGELGELARSIDQMARSLESRHDQAERQLSRLAALRNIDLAITSSLDQRVIFSVLLDEVTTQLGVDAAAIMLLNPHARTLEYAAGRGFRFGRSRRTSVRVGEGHAGRAALLRQVVAIPDLGHERRKGDGETLQPPLITGELAVAYYAVPLVAKGQVKGVLEVFHREALDPDEEWLSFLEALAGQAAIAIDNASLFNELERSNVALTLAYDTTLEGWSNALDLRDKETEGHTRRVTEMAVELARAMGMDEADLVQVRRGALLHDIGKMGIPDAILLKPGPLTEDEWEVMRRHPVYAYELLSPIEFLRPALDIPYCHHEKWDGSGYPRGLKGEQIPLAARVFAVVDVWDALCSDRPYRPAWPRERALEYIRAQAGTHFDPEVVSAFLTMLERDLSGADVVAPRRG